MSPGDGLDDVLEEGAEGGGGDGGEDPYFARLDAMDAARPKGVPKPSQLARSVAETGWIEEWQLEGYEAGVPDWWRIADEAMLDAALDALDPGELEEAADALSRCGEGRP